MILGTSFVEPKPPKSTPALRATPCSGRTWGALPKTCFRSGAAAVGEHDRFLPVPFALRTRRLPTGSRHVSPSVLVTQHSAKNRFYADCDHPNRSEDCLSLGLQGSARSRNSKRARLKQSQPRQTGPFRVLFASLRFLPALRAHGSSCRLRAAGAYEIEAGGPVCKATSSARRKHLGGSCSPPFLPHHGPVTQSSLPPSLTCPPIGSGISQDL